MKGWSNPMSQGLIQLVSMALSLASAIVLSGCANRHGPALVVAAPAAVHPIPDRTFFLGLADRAQAIRDTLQAVPTSALAKELDRTACVANLPRPLTKGTAWPNDELYAQRLPCVLVLATIGKCDDPECGYPGHAAMKHTASAFVLSKDGVCVTNRHVFEKTSDEEFMVAATYRGVVYPVVEILAANEHDDVVIFRIDTRGDEMSPIPLRSDAPVGTAVAVISHPAERCYTMTTGTIARRSAKRGDLSGSDHTRRRKPPKAVAPDLPIEVDAEDEFTQALEITAEYAVGSSGGPVLDDRGNAVGMVCATNTLYADREKREEPQAVVRTCVPAESILKMVKRGSR